MHYDLAGRLTDEGGPEGTSSYTYVPAGQNGVNKVATVSGFSGVNQSYTYDALSDVTGVTETINGVNYTKGYQYDQYGNNTTTTYPSPVSVVNTYDNYGYLLTIQDANTNTTLYTVNSMNGYGQAASYTCGNGKTTTLQTYFGLPNIVLTTDVQEFDYVYSLPGLDITQRSVSNHSAFNFETLTYDNTDRLTSAGGGYVGIQLVQLTLQKMVTLIPKLMWVHTPTQITRLQK